MLKNLAKNRTTEKDIRQWLTANGYREAIATLTEVELHAVQRPGWLQIFRFRVSVNCGDSVDECFGVVRDDERLRGESKTQIELFDSENLQQARLAVLSEELIVGGNRGSGGLIMLVLFAVLFLMCVAVILNLLDGG